MPGVPAFGHEKQDKKATTTVDPLQSFSYEHEYLESLPSFGSNN
jgi:hypothetical protein